MSALLYFPWWLAFGVKTVNLEELWKSCALLSVDEGFMSALFCRRYQWCPDVKLDQHNGEMSLIGRCRGSTINFELSRLGSIPDPTINCLVLHWQSIATWCAVPQMDFKMSVFSQISHLLALVGGY